MPLVGPSEEAAPVEGGDPTATGTVAIPSGGSSTPSEPVAADDGSVPPPSAAAMAEPEMWQLHRTYILAPVRGGLVIVDQHAAHERILYEEAIARLRSGQGSSQGLLFPALVDVSRAQFDLLLEVGPLLQQLGWDLSPLTPPTVVIKGVPSGLRVDKPGQLLQDVLDGISEGGPTAQDDMLERVAKAVPGARLEGFEVQNMAPKGHELIVGVLRDHGWSYGKVMALLALGQVLAVLIAWIWYPETAHLELEAINPDDPVIDD